VYGLEESKKKNENLCYEEVFVPLIQRIAFEVLEDFKKQLGNALNCNCDGKTIFVDDINEVQTILKDKPNWQRWFTVAKVKRADRMKVKTKEYADEFGWPGSEYLDDCLRAMVVCRGGEESGDTIYQTWTQLQKAFDIKKGNGRLNNNFATAGMTKGDQHQKPPDMLMNIILNVDGCMPIPAEIQVHHEEILILKETKTHLLYEIYRAKSIEDLRGSAQASNAQLTAKDDEFDAKLAAKDDECDAKLAAKDKELAAKEKDLAAKEKDLAAKDEEIKRLQRRC